MIKAVRLSLELNFIIEKETQEDIKQVAKIITFVNNELVIEELNKIIKLDPVEGFSLLDDLNLLQYIKEKL